MFHIYIIFRQIISLDDKILQQKCDIFENLIIWHCANRSFDGILRIYKKVPVLFIKWNSQPLYTGFPLFFENVFQYI